MEARTVGVQVCRRRAICAHVGGCAREQIILDAAEDGSSVLCKACGALVRADRKRVHDNMWCSSIPDEAEEDEAEAGR